MKKNEYMAPEMEIVEFTEQGGILQNASLGGGNTGGSKDEDNERKPFPGAGAGSRMYDED